MSDNAPVDPPLAGPRWRPFVPVRQRMQQWFESRLRRTDTLTLTQRNVYILPTRPGFMLALTLAVLLVGSINYQLNLGYLLTFLLAGSAVVGMHVCHNNLRGLVLHMTPPAPAFAGTASPLELRLSSERPGDRPAIGLAVVGSDRWAWVDVPGQGSATVQVAFTPQRRGLQPVPTLTAETRYPLGTFRVWTVWRPASPILVYPRAELRPPPLPPGEARAGGGAASRRQSSGEFDGVRAYQRGDPVKLVVWKKFARSQELVSRDQQASQYHELWLDFTGTGVSDIEARLSRLCAWVLLADRLGQAYGLRLPGREIRPDTGTAHRLRCLEALALC
ncbi:MAG: DUF58 domain-containing protein [Burkholderiaceae bacterium]|jgi:uncharacterized protein (DUF58 family)|nr:DUF58 domain-containing protein [Burkholderiaceae bacterium]